MMKVGKSIGFKDMHPMQVEAIMQLIGESLYLASVLGEDELAATEETVDELVKLFGGNGVRTVIVDH
jgi:hypothetical protein